MYDLMLYSLKTGACLAIFYLFFKLLLSRETFHRMNRILLLAAIVASFLLPLCVITVYRELPVVPALSELVTDGMAVAPKATVPASFPWEKIAGWVFLLGAVGSLASTVRSLWGVVRRIRRSPRERLSDGVTLVRSVETATPFSWWRYVVISESDLRENGAEILLHEKAHLRLRHSLDLLVTDIAGCLQWFNPAMWLLRRELRDIHEYEADEAVLDSGADARQYQMLLIKKAAGGRWYSVANSFNHSKLKNRITMMLRKKSSRWAGAKALLTLPLAGLALGAFAETVYVLPKDKDTQKNFTFVIDSLAVAAENGEPAMTFRGAVDVDMIGDSVVSVTLKKEGERFSATMRTNRNDSPVGADAKIQQTNVSSAVSGEAPNGLKAQNMTITVTGDGEQQTEVTPQGYSYYLTMTGNGDANAASADGIRSAQNGIREAREAIESARGKLSKEQLKLVKERLDVAEKQLEEAQKQQVQVQVDAQVAQESPTDNTVAGESLFTDKIVISGVPGTSGETIRIRTTNTPKGVQPLWIVDGKETDGNVVQTMNPSQIESISVLKDGSAVKVYGERAKNGVVVVQTRKSVEP